MQTVDIKSTREHLGSLRARLWPIIETSHVLYLLPNFFIFQDKIWFDKCYSKSNILMLQTCSLMKDNLIWNILIKAVVCFNKKCKNPGISLSFQKWVMCKTQPASDHLRLFTYKLSLLVWNDDYFDSKMAMAGEESDKQVKAFRLNISVVRSGA